LRALVRAFPAGVVVDVDDIEDLAVQRLCCLRSRLRLLYDGCRLLEEEGTPKVARLVEHGVGQYVVEEDLLGHFFRPRKLLAGFQREAEVLTEKFRRQRLAVLLGHMLGEEACRLFAEGSVLRFGGGDEIVNGCRNGGEGGGDEADERAHGADRSEPTGPINPADARPSSSRRQGGCIAPPVLQAFCRESTAAVSAAMWAGTRSASAAGLGVSNVNESGQPRWARKIASGQRSGRSASAAW